MQLQRTDGSLPGAEHLLAATPDGSISACMQDFLDSEVVPLSVTARRAYERTLVLLMRDFNDAGPALDQPCNMLTHERFLEHLAWRRAAGLTDPAELVRCTVHIARLAAWMDTHHNAGIHLDQEALRAAASE